MLVLATYPLVIGEVVGLWKCAQISSRLTTVSSERVVDSEGEEEEEEEEEETKSRLVQAELVERRPAELVRVEMAVPAQKTTFGVAGPVTWAREVTVPMAEPGTVIQAMLEQLVGLEAPAL